MTKRGRSDIIAKLSARGDKREAKKLLKKDKKVLKNLLTKAKACDIIIRLPQKRAETCTLKIEQQKTKQSELYSTIPQLEITAKEFPAVEIL